MKLICVVTLFIAASAILSCGDGVATLDPGTSTAGAATVTQGNNNATALGTNTNEPSVNPAHGKPGHRCDIAVGAPLTSNPAAQPSTVVEHVPTIAPASTNPTSTLPVPSISPNVKPLSNPSTNIAPTTRLNPPHGQPGHRCDIAVGKPLDGKASTPTTTTLPSALPNLTSPTITPPASSTVAPGMNPSHGQPGHRCDIPVGKPLNSKPAQ
jgi:hypothetical protein